MYSTCLFCHGSLGRNTEIEHFPVGQRLAFDGARGRLWAICPGCARWNLTPLEERWEAIEECERLFPRSERRIVTSDIALVRHSSGLELVRIGTVERNALSAWRWGREMRSRRVRSRLIGGLSALVTIAELSLPLAWLPARILVGIAGNQYKRVQANRPALHVTDAAGDRVLLREGHVSRASVVPGDEGGWALDVQLGDPSAERESTPPLRLGRRSGHAPSLTLAGAEAERVVTLAAARRNRQNSAGEVEVATRMLATTRSREALVARTLGELANAAWYRGSEHGSLDRFSSVQSVLLEMALAESTEDAALAGEVATLEAAWRDAEEIAAIADSLLVPDDVDRRLRELRAR